MIAVFLFLFCQCTAADSLTELRLLCSTASLRYSQALTAEQISAVTASLQSEANAEDLGVSFWREDSAAFSAAATQRLAGCVPVIRFTGNAQDVYGASYLKGSAPKWSGSAQCAVSQPLAWALWGSTDVLGQEVQIALPAGGAPLVLTVCGVFDANRELLLCPADSETGFPYLEVKGLRRDDPFTQCGLFLQQAGLGQPEQLLFGDQIAALFSVCAFLPWCFGVILLLAAVRRLLCANTGARRGFDIFCTVLLVAVCAAVLHRLPAWLIPNRWADAAAWKAVIGPIREQWQQWLALAPTGKDIRIKICIAKLICAWHGEAFCFFLMAHALFSAHTFLPTHPRHSRNILTNQGEKGYFVKEALN